MRELSSGAVKQKSSTLLNWWVRMRPLSWESAASFPCGKQGLQGGAFQRQIGSSKISSACIPLRATWKGSNKVGSLRLDFKQLVFEFRSWPEPNMVSGRTKRGWFGRIRFFYGCRACNWGGPIPASLPFLFLYKGASLSLRFSGPRCRSKFAAFVQLDVVFKGKEKSFSGIFMQTLSLGLGDIGMSLRE